MPFLPTRKNYSNAFVVGGGGRGGTDGGVFVCVCGGGGRQELSKQEDQLK